MSAADKSRQSSGAKSFFSRGKKEKGDRRNGEESSYLGGDLDKASLNGSRSSRHTRTSSIASLERPNSPPDDNAGLAMMTGVITSIPYDSVMADSRSPISVDYLPRGDQMPVRRDPLPHHLNKGGGDFHQYPSFDPSAVASSHPTGPRPPPGNITMASTGQKAPAPQQWGAARSSVASTNNGNSRYDSYTNSMASRSSYDQQSVSSGTERSSVFSSSNSSSRTAMPNSTSQTSLTPSQASSRESHRLTRFPHHQPGGFGSTGSFAPDGFSLTKPTDDRVIEEQFLALMQKRGWHNLPEQARRQMQAYPA
jgi:cytokinesis protein